MLTYAKRGWFVPCIASVPSWSLARDDRNPWSSRGVQCPHRPGQATSLWHHWKNRQELHRSLQHVWGPCLRKPEMSRNWFHAFCAFFCLFALMRLFPLFPCLHKIEGTLPEQPSTLSNSQMLMACFEIVQNKPRMEYGRGETLLEERID